METRKKIGSNLEYYRKQLRFTQKEIAEYLGISRELISYYEGGERAIDLDKLERLADLYNIELIDLLTDKPSETAMSLSIALRAEDLTAEDLKSLSEFQKIVRNYSKMITLLQSNEG